MADALKELGYYFDNDLRLRRLSTDAYGDSTDIPVDPFATIQQQLILKYKCEELYIPGLTECQDPSARLPVYCSTGWRRCDTLVVIVPGTRTQPGIWSRSLCIDEGLQMGSMLPYVKETISRKYGIVISNPNSNFYKRQNADGTTTKIPIALNDTPEAHLLYLWDKLISPGTNKNIVFVAYGYGGVVVKNLLRLRPDSMNRIKCVAFLESVHTLLTELSLEEADSSQLRKYLETYCVNWKISNNALGYRLEEEEEKLGCVCLSAGPDMSTIPNQAHITILALNVVFQFIDVIVNKGHDALYYADSILPVIDNIPPSKSFDDGAQATTPPRGPMNNNITSCEPPKLNEEPNQLPVSCKRWIPDNEIIECQVCLKPFSFLVRKHHCRCCGRIICSECSKNSMRFSDLPRSERVCYPCFNEYQQKQNRISQQIPRAPSNRSDGGYNNNQLPNINNNYNNNQNGNGNNNNQNGPKELSKNDFQLLKAIGKGSFGKVLLVRRITDNKVYALKILSKAFVVERKQVEHTKTERKILEEVNHPFVSTLRFAFQTEGKLYLGMDFYAGGPLFYHLQQCKRFSEDRAKFYVAEVVSGVSYLHSKNILYRDMKPENLLLDRDGHVIITDFGLSKTNVSEDNAQTICGTPEYVAPEVLMGKPYGKAVDWWSVGTLLYEMMAGLPPFYDKNRKVMFQKILHDKLKFPSQFSSNARSVIEALLNRNPSLRLGSGPRDALDVEETPFFSTIDFKALEEKRIEPPWKPVLTGDTDTSNFNKKYTRVIPDDSSPTDEGSIPIPSFEGFTYDNNKELE